MVWTPLPNVVEVTVNTPQPKEFVLDPATTAIVVVDMQNVYRWGRFAEVAEGNERLLAKARKAGAKVLFIQSVRQPESPSITLWQSPVHLQQGSWDVKIMEELSPVSGEAVIQKWSNDVWSWYGLEAVLEREGIVADKWTILVTGVSAAGCAEAAALGFANRLYRTLIPLDCTAADIEGEARTFSLYMKPDYRFIMDFTLSSKVDFANTSSLSR